MNIECTHHFVAVEFAFIDTLYQLPFAECFHLPRAQDYRGRVAVTATGIACQSWGAQYPHEHKFTPEAYAQRGIGQHNHCRNPDDDTRPWCYTTDRATRWAYCSVGSPSQQHCRNPGCLAREIVQELINAKQA